MDWRIATGHQSLSVKREQVLVLFNTVLEDSIWSILYPLAAYQDRNNIASETALLDSQSSLQKIDDIRALIGEKSHYWDEHSKYRRAVLMAFFDFNALLLDLENKTQAVSSPSQSELFNTLDDYFLNLKIPIEKNYEQILNTLQPVINALIEFKEPASPSSSPCTSPMPEEDEERVDLSTQPQSQFPLKNRPPKEPDAIVNGVANLYWQAYQKAQEEECLHTHRLPIKQYPTLKLARKAVRHLFRLSQTKPSAMSEAPLIPDSLLTLLDYHRYFTSLYKWTTQHEVPKEIIRPKSPAPTTAQPAPTTCAVALGLPTSPTSKISTQIAQASTLPRTTSVKSQSYLAALAWGCLGLCIGALVGGGILILAPRLMLGTSIFVTILSLSGSAFALAFLSLNNYFFKPARFSIEKSTAPSLKTLSATAKTIFTPTTTKTKAAPGTPRAVFAAIKNLVLPQSIIDRHKLFSFWNSQDNAAAAKSLADINKEEILLPRPIATLLLLITQASTDCEQAKAPMLAMQNNVIRNEAVKEGEEIFEVTKDNLADVIDQHGFKKTLCTILAYRYIELNEKVILLELLLENIQRSQDYRIVHSATHSATRNGEAPQKLTSGSLKQLDSV